MAGGLGSTVMWSIAYPFDFLKTQLQGQIVLKGEQDKALGAFRLAQKLLAEHGIAHFYKGFHVQLIRAFPQNACAMLMYETVMTALKKRQGM